MDEPTSIVTGAADDADSSHPYGLTSTPTDAHPIKRPGRSLDTSALSLVLRSPREPKERLSAGGHRPDDLLRRQQTGVVVEQ